MGKKKRLIRLSCSQIAEGGFCKKNIKTKKNSSGKKKGKVVNAHNICQKSCKKCDDNIFNSSCKNDGDSRKKYKIITKNKKNKEIRKKDLCKSKLYKKPKILVQERCKKACGVCK